MNFLTNPLYALIGLLALVGITIGAVKLHDANVYDEGDKSGYSRSEKEHAKVNKLASDARSALALRVEAELAAKRAAETADLHAAEARNDELEDAFGTITDKGRVAWPKHVASKLR